MHSATRVLLAAAALACAAPAAEAATPVPAGKWSFVFADARGRADRPIRVYTYRPQRCDSACPLVFVLPGARRNAYDYIGHWELAADRHQFIVVAPEFRREAWPGSAAYAQGDVAAQPDREKWAFAAIEHLFDEVRSGQAGYALFGYSAGAQLVQRMALLRPDNRATLMVAANPGWFTLPEWRKEKSEAVFPYSLVGAPAGEAEVKRALARRLVVMVGEKDAEPDEDNLAAGAKAQGEGRIDRGETFFKAATAAAGELGVALAWELHELPATAGDGAAASRAASEIMFPKR